MVTPEDLLAAAEKFLLAQPLDEAHVRAAISRAYYAAYHAAYAFHGELPLPGRLSDRPGGEHENLIQRLERPDPRLHDEVTRISKLLAVRLRAMRDVRLRADYKLQTDVIAEEARKIIIQARGVLQICKDGTGKLASLGAQSQTLKPGTEPK